MTIEQQIKELQDKLLDSIINNEGLSKIEKLKAIRDNKLFDIKYPMQDVFLKYEKILDKQIEDTGELFSIIDDCLNDPDNGINKGSIIDLVSDIESRFDDYEYFKNQNPNYMITIVKSRCDTPQTYELSIEEYIDHVYDWCVENKCVEYVFDW